MPIRLPLPMPVTFLWAIAAASAAGLIAFSYFAKPGEGTIGLLGTLLGFLLTTVVNRTSEQSQDDKRMRTARMCLANDLRHWLNAASDVVDDERYFESSDGNIGKLRYELPAFRFEHDLKHIAVLDAAMSQRLFELIHSKDGANGEIEGILEVEPDALGGMVSFRCAELFLKGLEIYKELCSRVEWRDDAFSADVENVMREEIEKYRKHQIQIEEAQANNAAWHELCAAPAPVN